MGKHADRTAEKTNAMRILEQHKIKYESYTYEGDGQMTGEDVARMLGQNPDQVFKTLVTVGKSGQHYVFVIPVAKELDLKKAAACTGEKKIEMVKAKELLPLTGYIHGGCSPVGMKKQFPTFFDEAAAGFGTIIFSGGRIGFQVELALPELERILPFRMAELVS